jgi:hypothetical protein
MTFMYVVTCLSHEPFCLCTVLPQSLIYKAAISISRLKNFSLCRFFKFVDMSRFSLKLLYLKTFSYFSGTENEGEIFPILFEEIRNYMEIILI